MVTGAPSNHKSCKLYGTTILIESPVIQQGKAGFLQAHEWGVGLWRRSNGDSLYPKQLQQGPEQEGLALIAMQTCVADECSLGSPFLQSG